MLIPMVWLDFKKVTNPPLKKISPRIDIFEVVLLA